MFCKNCGSEIPEGSVFCQACGARVPKEAEVSEVKETAQTVQSDIENETRSLGAQASAEWGNAPAETEGEREILSDDLDGGKKKRSWRIKGKRWPVIAIIAFVVLLATSSAVLAFPYVKHAVLRTVMPADKYFVYVIKENAEDMGDQIGSMIDLTKEAYGDGTTQAEISLEVGDGLKDVLSMVSMMSDSDMTGETAWFQDITVDMTQVREGLGNSISWNVHMNGTDILSVNMTYDPEQKTIYWSLPEINPETLGMDMGEAGGLAMQQSTAFVQAMPNRDVAKKMMAEYIKTIALNINHVEKSREPLTANGDTEKYCCLTATIDGKTMNQIEIAVLEQAKADAELGRMIRTFAQAMGMNEDEAYQEFQTAAERSLESLRSKTPREDDGAILKLWVNGKGEIVGIRLKPQRSDEYVQWAHIQHYKKASTEFCYVSHDEKMLSLSGNSKDHGGWFWTWDGARREGDYALSVSGTEYLFIRTQDVSVGWLESGQLQGKMEMQLSKDAFTQMGMPPIAASMLQDMKIAYDAPSVDNRNARCSWALYKGDGMLFKLSASSKITDGGTVDIPTQSTSGNDSDALFGWLNGCNFDGVIQNMRTAGAPAWLINSVEESLNRWKNDLSHSEEPTEDESFEGENVEEGFETDYSDEAI